MLKNLFSKTKLSYVFLGILILIGAYYYFFQKDNNINSNKMPAINIEVVGTGSLKETIDVVGTSQLVDEQSLSFNKVGTITKVNFKSGDKVKKGDIIAQIDNSDGENSIKEAQIILDNAKISLQELYQTVDESKILQSQNSIRNTQNSIDIAQKELENLTTTQENSLLDLQNNIENLKKDLQTAKDSLDLSKSDLELSKKNLELTIQQQNNSFSNTTSNKSTTITQIENSFTSDLTSISKIIEQSDYILGVTDANKTKNDEFEMYLGAKNNTYKTQAESALLSSIGEYNLLKQKVDNYDKTGDIEKIKPILLEFKNIYSLLEKTTDLTYKTLENSVISNILSESELESKKSTMYNYLTTVQTKSNSITSSINTLNTLTNTNLLELSNTNNILSLENSISQKEESIKSSEISIGKKVSEIETKQKDYETTKNSYQITLKNKNDNLEQLKETLKVNQISLQELLEGPTDQNVKKAKNSITQAELKLKSAQESLDDYNLEAPFDGVIRKIDYMVGDNLTTDVDKYVYIENPDLLEVTVMLDQVDIGKVEVGSKAIITFDAYPTIGADGVISQIDTTPVQSSGVTSYTVTLILDDNDFKKKILSGMTADVEIIVEQKENIILVSTTAISSNNNKNYVTIQRNGQPQKVEVTVGMASGGKTEIISGLFIGDKIITKSYNLSNGTGTTTKPTGLFPTGGNRNRSSDMGGPSGGF